MSKEIEIVADFDTLFVQANEEECYVSEHANFEEFMSAHNMELSENKPDHSCLTRVKQKIKVSLEDKFPIFNPEKVEIHPDKRTFPKKYNPVSFFIPGETHPKTHYYALWIKELDNYLLIPQIRSYKWAIGTFDDRMGDWMYVASENLKRKLQKFQKIKK